MKFSIRVDLQSHANSGIGAVLQVGLPVKLRKELEPGIDKEGFSEVRPACHLGLVAVRYWLPCWHWALCSISVLLAKSVEVVNPQESFVLTKDCGISLLGPRQLLADRRPTGARARAVE